MITFLSILVLVASGLVCLALVIDYYHAKEVERHIGRKPNPINSTIRQYERSKH